MNLQFTNKGGNFVSEFEVTSDFNLHIEGVRLSDMHIYQKTAGGSYAKVTDFPSERSQDRVADFDFASLVYPKFIKVVCDTEPTNAELVTDGEVTEIKSQSKEVEITANGVTEIAPDNGFGYLSGVKVNVNVPQSGGGDAPSGGDCENMYISYNKDNPEDFGAFTFASLYGSLWKGIPNNGGEKVIANFYMVEQLGGIVAEAAMIPISEKTRTDDGKLMTYKDMVADMESMGVSFHRITKEEFYTI